MTDSRPPNHSSSVGKILQGLKIEDLSRGGNGVARQEIGGSLRVIFVPHTLPGDVVTAKIVEEQKRFSTAQLETLEHPSSDRVEPRCSVFGRCGGCSWQHVPYSLQWKTKRDGVLHALRRTEVTLPSAAIEEFPAREAWGYRNRIQLRAKGDPIRLGFFGRKSHEIVDVQRCDIAREELNRELPRIRNEAEFRLNERRKQGEIDPELKVEIDVLPSGEVRTAWNARHGALGFRQVNDEQNQLLRQWVRQGLSPGAHVFDLFGGAGNFTYEDSARYAFVECVDLGSPEGGFGGQPKNYRFFKSDVSRWLDRRAHEAEKGSLKKQGSIEVVLDPPREGLGDRAHKIMKSLDMIGIDRVIAVGCDPDSWARDLSRFVKYGWRVVKIGVFDLFPQTPHVEAVAVLEK